MIIGIAAGLTALFFLVFGGSSGSEEAFKALVSKARDSIVDVVKDKERKKAISQVFDDNKEIIGSIDEVIIERRREFWGLDANFDATYADYERVIEWLDGAWVEGFDRLVDLRGEVVKQMTAKEWQILHERWHKSEGKHHPMTKMTTDTPAENAGAEPEEKQ